MTQIIATIGPATENKEKISSLIEAGVDFFRLNFSHGSHEWHKKTIQKLRSISPETPIILDTKGPEMRTGDMPKECPEISLKKNEILTLVTTQEKTDEKNKKIFVNYAGLANDVGQGDIISIDSGLIEGSVEHISSDKESIDLKILHGGKITSRRHINLVQKDISLPTITKDDEEDIRFGLQNGIDIIALSFLRCPTGVETVKNICNTEGSPHVKIWGKIESQKGVDNIDSLSQVLDGMMVARGDLGVETPLEEVPYIQQKIIAACKKENIFSIVATEMLESMTAHPRPTRAEISDVALAVWEGANAVMLSGETASGKYPIEAVRIMKKVVCAAEKRDIQVISK